MASSINPLSAPNAYAVQQQFQVDIQALNLRGEIDSAQAIGLLEAKLNATLLALARVEEDLGLATGRSFFHEG